MQISNVIQTIGASLVTGYATDGTIAVTTAMKKIATKEERRAVPPVLHADLLTLPFRILWELVVRLAMDIVVLTISR